MSNKINNYSEDMSISIGKNNLDSIKSGNGNIQFTGAYIYLAPICNFRCEGCFTHIGLENKLRLSFLKIKRIIDFAKSRGAKSIIFAGAGEPTLDPNFDKIIKYIKDQSLQTVLFTNMTTLKSKDQAKEILSSGSVIGKLYTLDEEKYNKMTHCENAFKNAMRGLNFLLDARRELEQEGKEVNLAVDSYISKKNVKDLYDILRFCREKKIIPYFEAFIELGQTKEMIEEHVLSEKELAELFLKLQKIDKSEFNINTLICDWTRNYGMDICNKATHMFCVREDGKVYMCVCSLREVGNISDSEDPYKYLDKIFDVKNKDLLKYFVCDKCSKLFDIPL